MKFTLSTKPLVDALALGVIDSNVSKFYSKSCLAQLTADRHTLKINLEASFVCSEIILKGSGDSDEIATVFVDCQLLKKLVGTFEAATTTIEYTEGGIVLHSGSSKFNLPKMVEGGELSLSTPSLATETSEVIKIDSSDWKFIKDYQMYAIAMSFVYPVYTRVWVSEDGKVIVGDFGQQLFTFSNKSKLGRTCLLSDTIVNLFNSLPDGATLTKLDKSYRIDVRTDTFEYCAEFTPQYEDEDGVGNYKASVISGAVVKDESNFFTLPVPAVCKVLSQADLLSNSTEDTIEMSLDSNMQFCLKDNNIDCKMTVEGTCKPFKVEFKTSLLKSVLNNLDEESVKVSPVLDEDESAAGVTVWTKSLCTMVGGTE